MKHGIRDFAVHLRKHRKQRKRNESFIVTGETEREKEEIIIADHVNTDACDYIDPGEYTVFDTCTERDQEESGR